MEAMVDGPTNEEQKESVHFDKKEKSVLQTKLTKLAVQIGYGGKKIMGQTA